MKCYLLGAGVSKSVGYPLGIELFDEEEGGGLAIHLSGAAVPSLTGFVNYDNATASEGTA